MVPACDFPASFDAFVAGFEAQEVEDKTSDGDEVVCSVIFSDSTAVFVKGDVEDPVAAVFNSPMLPRAAEPKHGDSPLPILLNPPVIPHEHCPQLGFCRSPAG